LLAALQLVLDLEKSRDRNMSETVEARLQMLETVGHRDTIRSKVAAEHDFLLCRAVWRN
jgi:hypothetical protein